MTALVFVYGTLLKGMDRGHAMGNGKFLGPGLVKATLFDLGFYPAIQSGHRDVIGELYEIDPDTLAQLDRIEGFEPAYPHSSLFLRKAITVTLLSDGSKVEACAYFREDAEKKGTVIECGDYRRYRTEKNGNKAWVIAYGSNIGRERLSRRVGELSDYKRGFLEGFQLVFNKQDTGDNSVYANIKYVGLGACPAVAWKLTESQIKILDMYEGVPKHYLRISVPFVGEGEETICQVYIAHPSQLRYGSSPEPEYVEYIREGYREHRFHPNYLEKAIAIH